jgi:hypothetical protein
MIGKIAVGLMLVAASAVGYDSFQARDDALVNAINETHPDLRVIVHPEAVGMLQAGCAAHGGVHAVFLDVRGYVAIGCSDGYMIQ